MALVSATGDSKSKAASIGEYAHPLYNYLKPKWVQLNQFYDNEVKSQGTEYLPKTGGQILDTNNGKVRYEAYKNRAIYYNYTKQTVRDSKNTIIRKPAQFKFPDGLEYMEDFFDDEGQDIYSTLEDTLLEQIKLSRVGRLIDIAKIDNEDRFQSIEYKALSNPAWNEQSEFKINDEWVNLGKRVVYILLNETCDAINEAGQFAEVIQYRILGLRYTNDSELFRYYTITLKESEVEDIKYFTSPNVFDLESVLKKYGDRYIEPNKNGRFANFIPFSFINDDDLKATPHNPILFDQSELSKSLYQGEANFREIIYQQTISTLFQKGVSQSGPILVGGQHTVSDPEADLKYVSIDGDSLAEVRVAQQNLKIDCQTFGGVEVSNKNTNESGKALETRVTLQTDKLRDISRNGVAGLVEQLRFAARWGGYNVDEVEGIANEDFRTERATTEDLSKMGEMWALNQITTEDYYKYQFENLYTNDRFEDWLKKINNPESKVVKEEEVQETEIVKEEESSITNASDELNDNVVEN